MKIKQTLQTVALLVSVPLLIASCSDKKVDQDTTKTTKTATKSYPLDICLVSGEKLGSMGEPHVFTHEGQEIKMCCDMCLPKFNKDPEKYLSKLK